MTLQDELAQTHTETKGGNFLQRGYAYIRQRLSYMDLGLLVTMLVLITFGLVMTFSSTMYIVESGQGQANPLLYLIKQTVASLLGYMMALVVVCLPYPFLREQRYINVYNIGIFILLVITFIIGAVGGGAKSWISIGPLSLQPSEFSKLTLLLLLANYLVYSEREYILSLEKLKQASVSKMFILAIAMIGLIFIQPDWGMGIILLLTAVYTLFVYRFSFKQTLKLCGLTSGLILVLHALSHYASNHMMQSDNYRWERVGSFSNPFKYAQGAGYQLINGFLAFNRGGWFGRGLGNSMTKLEGLPAGHTDFILAVIGEEFGFVGVVIFLAVFFSLIVRLFFWSARMQDGFRKCVLLGIGCLFLIQALFNLGGIAGLVPLTGVTLPFTSYGGSSMMVSILAIGVAQAMIIEEKLVTECVQTTEFEETEES